MYEQLKELKEDTNKQLTEPKNNSSKQLNEIKTKMQDMKEIFNEDIKILKNNEILEMKASITQIKSSIKT
jgi:hypothetical protein